MWLELKERFWEAEVLWGQEPGVLQASLLGGTPHFQVPSLLRKHQDETGAQTFQQEQSRLREGQSCWWQEFYP